MRAIRVLTVTIGALAAFANAEAALAHAAYKSSEPPDGGRVGSPPTQVSAEFTEPLAGGSYLQITDPCGRRVDGGDVSITGYTMSVSMDGSAAGRYVVFYRAHSQLDPHVTQGEFDFTASMGAACAGSERGTGSTSGGGGGGGGSSGSAGGSPSGDGGPAAPADDAAAGSTAPRTGPERGQEAVSGGETARSRLRQDRGAKVPNIAAGRDQDPEARPVWEGIKLEPFLTSLILAAIIGAAGGKIYAGIMGPRA